MEEKNGSEIKAKNDRLSFFATLAPHQLRYYMLFHPLIDEF
jgi:hypothetical protein